MAVTTRIHSEVHLRRRCFVDGDAEDIWECGAVNEEDLGLALVAAWNVAGLASDDASGAEGDDTPSISTGLALSS